MAERRTTVGSSHRLHTRPAAIFFQAVATQPVKVTIAKVGGAPVDARSMLSMLALDTRGGEEIVPAAEGDGAEQPLDTLVALVSRDLDKE
jgi:phosphocarrier protein HPr